MLRGRPFAAERVEAADCLLRPSVPHEREDGHPPDPGADFGYGQVSSVRQGMHDHRFGKDFRATGPQAMAGRMNLVDIVTAFHLQDAVLEKTVGNGILVHLGALEKADGVFRQGCFLRREPLHGSGQVRPERRRGLSLASRDQRPGEDRGGRQQEPEDLAFHDIVREHEDGADCRAEDGGSDLQEQRGLRLDHEVSAEQEGRARTAQRERPERRNHRPGRAPAAEKPNPGPPEPGPRQNSDDGDLLRDAGRVQDRRGGRRQKREPVHLSPFHGIPEGWDAACRGQQEREEEDPVHAVHGGDPPGMDGVRQCAEERYSGEECAREAEPWRAGHGLPGQRHGIGRRHISGWPIHACLFLSRVSSLRRLSRGPLFCRRRPFRRFPAAGFRRGRRARP